MPQKSLEKNKDVLKELEKKISPVLIVNNSSLKPYVELFEYSPENVYQQPLGSLTGFFEIKEYSDDSAYIVNFLTSVLKKEYYINPKRSVTESLDSALHKVNMALSELVKHGNIKWLGNLNAAICVLEKNNTHFSVTGSAKIFLYRNTLLSEISRDLAPDSPEPHPLKTFVNVSSGRLEKDDRLLITPEDIFHILPIAELKKNFQRLEGEKFVQFLKTALSNQMEMISAIVVEMTETEPVPEIKIFNNGKSASQAANVFSEKTFANANPALISKKQEFNQEAEEKEVSEYTDKKTGHIYVQGETGESTDGGQGYLYWDIAKEKVAQIWYVSKNNLRRRLSLYKKRLAQKRELIRKEKEKQKKIAEEEKQKIKQQKAIEKKQQEEQLAIQKREHEQIIAKEKEEKKQQELKRKEQEIIESPQTSETKKIQPEEILEKNITTPVQNQGPGLSFKEKLQRAIIEEQKQSSIVDLRQIKKPEKTKPAEFDFEEMTETEKFSEDSTEKNQLFEKIKTFFEEIFSEMRDTSQDIYENATSTFKKIRGKMEQFRAENTESKPEFYADEIAMKKESRLIPHLHKIKSLFASFSFAQKSYAVLALLLIIIIPIFINRLMNKPTQQTITELQNVPPSPSETLTNEKNINLSPDKKTILTTKENIIDVTATASGIIAITKTAAVMINNEGQQKEYPLPNDSGTALRATFMKDLSLIFILTDQNKIISFSPVSSKFAQNNISLPENSSSLLIGTYMTYLYVLDSKSNQIYRYPRATSGFGEKTNWLKEQTSLAQISDMTIDDNIYCIQNKKVIKFFKGKIQQFSLESSNTTVNFDKIFTNIDSEFLYILDVKNSRIIKFNKTDGSIVRQYFDEELKNGISISIDESKNTAFVATLTQLLALSL